MITVRLNMALFRYKYFTAVLLLCMCQIYCDEINEKYTSQEHSPKCPFSKIIEDVFKIHNKTSDKGIFLKDDEKTTTLIKSIANVTKDKTFQTRDDEQVNDIIDSINRIQKNMTLGKHLNSNSEDELNEAIILSVPKKQNKTEIVKRNVTLEDLKKNDKVKNVTYETTRHEDKSSEKTTEKSTYVEILTIEPNNTNKYNTSAHNIIDILKHLMPMFNSTLTKEIHNFTIIERDNTKNHSFSAVKNISTIVVTYCDIENMTKAVTVDDSNKETIVKYPAENPVNDKNNFLDDEVKYVANADEFLFDDKSDDNEQIEFNITVDEKRDLMEAADYGMQKMHELYSVMEPKLYSMGLWLDESDPARYVAAFNAPSDDIGRFTRYGYASLQAATRLRQLTRSSSGDGLESRMEEAQFPSVNALRQSSLMKSCPIRGTPKCPPASKRYRTHDGTCNNFHRPRWGSTMTPVQRFLTPSYSDGLTTPRVSITGAKLPSAREISSNIHEAHNVETPSITHLLMQWGQFVDHDITSTSQSRGFNGSVPRCCKDGGRDFVPRDVMHPECMPIAVPPSDPFYGSRGVRCLDFVRSSPAPRDDCSLGWREQLNQVSAYIDGSPLYGSSAQKSDKLRLFRNGMLQYGRVQQRRPLLPPERKDELCRGGAVSTDCFKSGDGRVNEHPGLVAAHIVWLRQHNRMAQELAHLNPHWSDEKIYQETRKIVGAMIQHITYKEFLPVVLGSEVMRLFELEPLKKGYYKNYDQKVNPSPASSFGSAAFRFGHSLVQPSMMRYDRFHRPINNNVSLHDELTNPSNIWSMGAVDRLLLGMVNQPIQKRDEFITEELTNHLFETPKFGFGMDLAAINIQRGRDHGLPSYTTWREPCGLTSITEFEDLFRVMPARTARKLQLLYRHVDDIDLFTGGISERPVVGGLVGPTFACIIAQQFSNLRNGDRFWYENGQFDSSFTPAQLQQIRRINLAQVLCRTLDTIDNIQPFVFLSADNFDNVRLSCLSKELNNFDLTPWTEIDNSKNDISKSDSDTKETTSHRPTTSTQTTTTKKLDKLDLMTSASNKLSHKVPKPQIPFSNSTNVDSGIIKHKPTIGHNKTMTLLDKLRNMTSTNTNRRVTKYNATVQKIDDKLDFKNKTTRNDDDMNDGDTLNHHLDETADSDSGNKQRYDYDDDSDDTQSVQSVMINNIGHKRPGSYNRPVISVTENIDKYTYLINYVPKQTQSWRQTTRRPYIDRDVVKVTYQNYDDTYRRPFKPYNYNRHGESDTDNYRRDRPDRYTTNTDDLHSSARSNDDTVRKSDKLHNTDITTENFHKLVTFGYVGTYKANDLTDHKKAASIDIIRDDNADFPNDDALSKDFSTYIRHKLDRPVNDLTRLSTFYTLETVTKPYAQLAKSTKIRDDIQTVQTQRSTNPDKKYYYVNNALHKYPDIDLTLTERPLLVKEEKDIKKDNHHPGYHEDIGLENRAGDMSLADETMAQKSSNPSKLGAKLKKPLSSAAKTPSVTFQVMPSENSPSLWAVYEENVDLPDGLADRMPAMQTDPHALKELPRPLKLSPIKMRRRPDRK